MAGFGVFAIGRSDLFAKAEAGDFLFPRAKVCSCSWTVGNDTEGEDSYKNGREALDDEEKPPGCDGDLGAELDDRPC